MTLQLSGWRSHISAGQRTLRAESKRFVLNNLQAANQEELYRRQGDG